jgi:hypothetical protein
MGAGAEEGVKRVSTDQLKAVVVANVVPAVPAIHFDAHAPKLQEETSRVKEWTGRWQCFAKYKIMRTRYSLVASANVSIQQRAFFTVQA